MSSLTLHCPSPPPPVFAAVCSAIHNGGRGGTNHLPRHGVPKDWSAPGLRGRPSLNARMRKGFPRRQNRKITSDVQSCFCFCCCTFLEFLSWWLYRFGFRPERCRHASREAGSWIFTVVFLNCVNAAYPALFRVMKKCVLVSSAKSWMTSEGNESKRFSEAAETAVSQTWKYHFLSLLLIRIQLY